MSHTLHIIIEEICRKNTGWRRIHILIQQKKTNKVRAQHNQIQVHRSRHKSRRIQQRVQKLKRLPPVTAHLKESEAAVMSSQRGLRRQRSRSGTNRNDKRGGKPAQRPVIDEFNVPYLPDEQQMNEEQRKFYLETMNRENPTRPPLGYESWRHFMEVARRLRIPRSFIHQPGVNRPCNEGRTRRRRKGQRKAQEDN